MSEGHAETDGLIAEAERLLRETGTPGAAVALVADGEEALLAGVGWRDLAGTEPLDVGSHFPLYSITKTLIAIAVLRLVEAGAIALDAPIGEVLPESGLPAGVTVRRLLNHTAGLGDYGGMPAYAADLRANPAAPWSEAELLDRVLRDGLRYPPGEGWGYANVGYLLLRQAISRVTGQTFGEALGALVTGPAGAAETSVATTLDDMRALTPGFSDALDDDLRDVHTRYHPGWVSHGLAVSTAADTARIVEALFAGRLLGSALMGEMLTAAEVPHPHPAFAAPGYGLGLMIDRGAAGLVAGHAGGGPGYATAAFHVRTEEGRQVTSVALANRDGGEVGLRIALALARRWLAATG